MSESPRLAYLADVRLGRQRSPEHHEGDFMTPYLRSANVNPAQLVLDEVKEMNFPPADRAIFALNPGDILMTEGSGSRDTVGATAVWNGDLPGTVCFQNTLLRLRPGPHLDARFLFWWCQHAHGSGLLAKAAGGQSILHLGTEGVGNLRMKPPDLTKQRRIADFLDDQTTRIDGLIAARRQQMNQITALGHAEVVDILLGGGDLTGAENGAWFERLPDAWHVRPLRTEWRVIDCKHRTPPYIEDGYPVVSPGDVSPGRLDLTRCQRFVSAEDYKDLADDLRRCRPGDIVYSRNASAGTAAFVETSAPFTMGQDVCRITSGRRDQKYLFYVLNNVVEPQLESARLGSTITRINIDQIKALRVPIPSDREQREIAGAADRATSSAAAGVSSQHGQVTLLKEFKRSLISAAVSGEFDVSAASGRGVVV